MQLCLLLEMLVAKLCSPYCALVYSIYSLAGDSLCNVINFMTSCLLPNPSMYLEEVKRKAYHLVLVIRRVGFYSCDFTKGKLV